MFGSYVYWNQHGKLKKPISTYLSGFRLAINVAIMGASFSLIELEVFAIPKS